MSESNADISGPRKKRKVKMWLSIVGGLMILGMILQFCEKRELDAKQAEADRVADSTARELAAQTARHDSLMRTDKVYADSVRVAHKRRDDSLSAKQRQDSIEAIERDRRENPENHVDVDFNWRTGGFGSVALATIRFHNKSLKTCVNPVLLVTFYSENGTELSQRKEAVYVTIPPGKKKKSDELNLGFINRQAARAGAKLISATWE